MYMDITQEVMINTIKSNLQIMDNSQDIVIIDTILAVIDYCNLHPQKLPLAIEPFLRRKTKGIMDYEAAYGSGYVAEVQSIKEGDGSITYALTDGNTKSSIYGLSDTDKKELRRHRRLRGYVKPICSDV